MIFNLAEFPASLNLPELAGEWITVIDSADASWRGPDPGRSAEIEIPITGPVRRHPHSFLVIERARTSAEAT
jgi:hypothetical protein